MGVKAYPSPALCCTIRAEEAILFYRMNREIDDEINTDQGVCSIAGRGSDGWLRCRAAGIRTGMDAAPAALERWRGLISRRRRG